MLFTDAKLMRQRGSVDKARTLGGAESIFDSQPEDSLVRISVIQPVTGAFTSRAEPDATYAVPGNDSELCRPRRQHRPPPLIPRVGVLNSPWCKYEFVSGYAFRHTVSAML
jgi:hypothetical protein